MKFSEIINDQRLATEAIRRWIVVAIFIVIALVNVVGVLALCVGLGAVARQESRGAHFRTDYNTRDDVNWLKHTFATRKAGGALEITVDRGPSTGADVTRGATSATLTLNNLQLTNAGSYRLKAVSAKGTSPVSPVLSTGSAA